MKLSEIAKRLIIKSKSNLSRYILGNLSATEFRIAELQLLDLASAVDNLDEYTQVAQAVYGDVTKAKVEL
jgi:hypothetical protein